MYLPLVSHWVTATLEFGHKEWLQRLGTLQTFDTSDKKTQIKKKTKTRKREFNIVVLGQFHTPAMF